MSQPQRAEARRFVEVAILERALVELDWYAQPGRSNWSTDRVRTNGSPDAGDDETSWAREALRQLLDEVESLTRKVRRRIRDGRATNDPRESAVEDWNRRHPYCPHCRKRGRFGSRYCDRCGDPISDAAHR